MIRNLVIFFALIHFSCASEFYYDPAGTLCDNFFDYPLFEEGLFENRNILSDPLEIWKEDQDFEFMTSRSLSEGISSSEGSLPQAPKPASSRLKAYEKRIKSQNAVSDKLKQIFNSQYPLEKFNLRQYDVINWPEDVDIFSKKKWTILDLEKIESHLGDILFKRRDQKITRKIQYNAADLEEHAEAIDMSISYEEAYSIVKKRFQEETGYKSYIRWHLLDKSALPSKYAKLTFNNQSFLLMGLHKNREILDNIHFKKKLPKNKEGELVEEEPVSRGKLKANLKKVFNLQHPQELFYLGDFEVQNWPEDVDILKAQWSPSEMAKINEKLPQLVFIKRLQRPLISAAELGLEKLGDMSDILRSGWSEEDTNELLQERNRLETDYPVAKSTDLTDFDQVWIPKKYEPFPINYAALNMAIFFRNPAIIDGIQEGSKKRQSEQIDDIMKIPRRTY